MLLAARGVRCRRAAADAQHLLVPMDDAQQNHLKAYGLTFNALKAGDRAEWFINYRGGSFLLPDGPELRKRATLDGVTFEPLDNGRLAQIRAEIASGNMDAVTLEKAPKIAIYTPPKSPPWDDAVTLALRYAGIEYTTVWDDEVMNGDLKKYDWLHLLPRGLHRAAQQAVPRLPRRAVVRRAARAKSRCGEAPRVRDDSRAQEGRGGADPAIRRGRRVPVRDVRRDRDAGARDRGA